MIEAKIIADSVSDTGAQLTTFELTYPRFIHAEFMTHRVISKNAASSRAIPSEKMIKRVSETPIEIVWWGRNQSGMQAREELSEHEQTEVRVLWEEAKHSMIEYARLLQEKGLHKQLTNRLLEPFSNITVIATATDWCNFYALRCHPDAQPEIQRLAYTMLRADYNSVPRQVGMGEWHTPYLTEAEMALDLETRLKVSVAKSARVSYLTHDQKRDYTKDLELYDRLYASGHFSPFEHVATPLDDPEEYSGNFRGWLQYRKTLKGEERTNEQMPTPAEVELWFEQHAL